VLGIPEGDPVAHHFLSPAPSAGCGVRSFGDISAESKSKSQKW
jgi:hypothetical protein